MRRYGNLIFLIVLFIFGFWQKDGFAELKGVCVPGSFSQPWPFDCDCDCKGLYNCPVNASVCQKLPYSPFGSKDWNFLLDYGSSLSDTIIENLEILKNLPTNKKNILVLGFVNMRDNSEDPDCHNVFGKCWGGPIANHYIEVIPYLKKKGPPPMDKISDCAGAVGPVYGVKKIENKDGTSQDVKYLQNYVYTVHLTGPFTSNGEFYEEAYIGAQYVSYLNFFLWDFDWPWQEEWGMLDDCFWMVLFPQLYDLKDIQCCLQPSSCEYGIALRHYESDEECGWGSLGGGDNYIGGINIEKGNCKAITLTESHADFQIYVITENCIRHLDYDADFITNEDENYLGLDPNNPDSNFNGINDYDELKPIYDPDGDYILGFHDNCPYIYNPLVPKPCCTFHLGICHLKDYPSTTSFLQCDNDNDMKGDECDPDDDNDGIPDTTEIALGLDPWTSNNNTDSDSDGLLDFDEVMKYKTNPKNPDTDGDGISDGLEIKYLLNPLDSSDGKLDTDNDGLSNVLEFQLGTHYKKGDTDDDGMPDGWEHKFGLNPTQKDGQEDADNDGVMNLEEYQKGLDPTNPDTDSDGVIDGQDNCPRNPNSNQSDVNKDGAGDVCDMDADGDGYCDLTKEVEYDPKKCPKGGGDCDDNNPNIHPSQKEIPYDGLDNDCLPQTPDDDLDQDGYNLIDDCNDQKAEINPGRKEIPYNGADDDCNPETLDCNVDGDGYDNCFQGEHCLHNPNIAKDLCDCNDNNKNVNPSAKEIPYNCENDDCDDSTPDRDNDFDHWQAPAKIVGGEAYDCDGHLMTKYDYDCDDLSPMINPMMQEICNNNIDDDCDGLIDENCEQPLTHYPDKEDVFEEVIFEEKDTKEVNDEISTIWVEPTSSIATSGNGCTVDYHQNSAKYFSIMFLISFTILVIKRKFKTT